MNQDWFTPLTLTVLKHLIRPTDESNDLFTSAMDAYLQKIPPYFFCPSIAQILFELLQVAPTNQTMQHWAHVLQRVIEHPDAATNFLWKPTTEDWVIMDRQRPDLPPLIEAVFARGVSLTYSFHLLPDAVYAFIQNDPLVLLTIASNLHWIDDCFLHNALISLSDDEITVIASQCRVLNPTVLYVLSERGLMIDLVQCLETAVQMRLATVSVSSTGCMIVQSGIWRMVFALSDDPQLIQRISKLCATREMNRQFTMLSSLPETEQRNPQLKHGFTHKLSDLVIIVPNSISPGCM